MSRRSRAGLAGTGARFPVRGVAADQLEIDLFKLVDPGGLGEAMVVAHCALERQERASGVIKKPSAPPELVLPASARRWFSQHHVEALKSSTSGRGCLIGWMRMRRQPLTLSRSLNSKRNSYGRTTLSRVSEKCFLLASSTGAVRGTLAERSSAWVGAAGARRT